MLVCVCQCVCVSVCVQQHSISLIILAVSNKFKNTLIPPERDIVKNTQLGMEHIHTILFLLFCPPHTGGKRGPRGETLLVIQNDMIL